MATTPIDNLEIRIQANAPNVSNSIDSLVASLSGMKTALKGGIGSLTTIAKQLDRLNDSVTKFAIDRLEQIADVLRDLKGVGKVNVGASVAMNVPGQNAPVSGVVDQGSDVAGAAEEAAEAEEKADEATESWGDSLQALSGSLKKVTERAAKFFESFKRIARLMIIRALIRGLISGLKEGIKNLRAWSETTNQVFAKSMDRAAAAAVNFKNAIAVAVAPIINVLVPYLVRATQKVMEFANALANMFAAFSGKSTFDAVIWGAEKTDESLTSAGKAAKKLKDLLGFDEINRLSDKSSGGGGGGSSIAGWDGAFEERNTSLEEAKKLLGEILGIITLITALKIWKYLPQIAKWLNPLSIAYKTVGGFKGILSSITTQTAKILGLVAAVGIALVDYWDTWVESVKKTWADLGLTEKFLSLWNTIKTTFGGITSLLAPLVSAISGFVHWVFDLVGSVIITGAIGAVMGAINGVVVLLRDVFGGINKIFSGVVDLIRAVIKLLHGDFKGAFEDAASWVKKVWGGMKEILLAPLNAVWEFLLGFGTGIANAWTKITNRLNETLNEKFIRPINKIITKINDLFGTHIGLIDYLSTRSDSGSGGGTGKGYSYYQEFAAGGFPQIGQTFIARESGPELVGTIGGRTAVATNNDIVAAVSQGVASAVASVMGNGSNGQNISLTVDGRTLFNIMVNQNNSIVRQTGASPLLV